jgi:superfamily II DNA or RNA helicase
MARAVLGDDALRSVGTFALRPAQREAVRAAERALTEYGGALIADAPGTGKTVLALAIAARFDDVLVIAPAALRAQWERAAERAGLALRVETMEGLSHGRSPQPGSLIVVDEAHHFRTPTTARYRALASLAVHRRLLLLTATPVVNGLRDRDALLALFLGERAAQLKDSVLAAVILRLASATSIGDSTQRLPALAAASDLPGLAQVIKRLPAPLPLADGGKATAIVRLSLAFAWASSLAALDLALRRRIERGRTLDDQLAIGRWPSREALRDWIFGDDATQLAFGFETIRDAMVDSIGKLDSLGPLTDARRLLGVHLDAVNALRMLLRPHVERDTLQRAHSLQSLLAECAPRRVVVLAHSAVTVRALYSALRAAPGVVAITGNRVHAAAGRWTRDEVLRALGPGQAPYDSRDARGIRLLIATDILAEGVELQAASVLVHADSAWTPARLEQRVGRLAREGQRERVLVTRFAVPKAAMAILQMRERLRGKAKARTAAQAPADAEAELRRRLVAWASTAVSARRDPASAAVCRVAAVHGRSAGFLALLRENGVSRLVAGVHQASQWRVQESPSAVLNLIPGADLRPARLSRAHLSVVRRILQRWHRKERGAGLASDQASLPQPLLRGLSRAIDVSVAAAPLSERARIARELSGLRERVSLLRGRGAEQVLKSLLRTHPTGEALSASLRALCDGGDSPMEERPAPHVGTGRLRVETLLILVPESGPALP